MLCPTQKVNTDLREGIEKWLVWLEQGGLRETCQTSMEVTKITETIIIIQLNNFMSG